MSKKQSRFTMLLLGLCGIGAVILTLGLLGFQQFSMRAAQYEKKSQALRQECEQITAELATRGDKEGELDELVKVLQTLDQNMTDYEYIPTFLNELQDTAEHTGNAIRSIRPRDMEKLDQNSPLIQASRARREAAHPEKATPADARTRGGTASPKDAEQDARETYRVQQITLEIDGTYVSLMRFLSVLSKFRKLVYVRTLSITPGRDDVNALTARMETYAIITPDQYQAPAKKTAVAPVSALQPEGSPQ